MSFFQAKSALQVVFYIAIHEKRYCESTEIADSTSRVVFNDVFSFTTTPLSMMLINLMTAQVDFFTIHHLRINDLLTLEAF